MSKLTAAERQAQIVELLSNNGTMKIIDLANYFHVSRETIRRDLIVLNEAGSIKKWVVPAYDFETRPVDTRMKEREDSKTAICEKAFELLRDRSVLYLDTGSTVLCLAKRLKSSSGHTIITNSIPVINELIGSDNQLIVTGGSIDQRVMCVMGSQTISFLECIKIDAAILGSSGFERHNGPTSNTFEDCQIKKTAIQNAQTSIVLADSSKATYSSLTQYASWRDIDYLVTDNELSKEMQQQLKDMTTVVLS